MDWGMISSPFLRRGTITTEEDGFYSVEVIILLQVLEDLEEELFGVLIAAGKVVGILELYSP